jgi:thimet oligopeptidase
MALVLPTYPLNPDEVKAQAESAIKTADAALTALAAQDPAKATFASTFAAYDAATARVSDAYAVINTVAESALDKTMRDTANEMSVKLQEWSVGLDYRADLYQALKAFADTKPKLDEQEQRLVDDQMRAYRRAGLSLPAAGRTEVEKLRKELAGLSTEFAVNINNARAPARLHRRGNGRRAAELPRQPRSEAARWQIPRARQRHLARCRHRRERRQCRHPGAP